MKLSINYTLIAFLAFLSCNLPDGEQIDVLNENQSVAIPIVNTTLTVADVASGITQGNASVESDMDGKITAIYSGDLIGFSSTSIFPPIPGILDNVLTDTLSDLPLPIKAGHSIRKAVFKNTNMTFRFRSSNKKKFSVTMTLPDVTKEGEVWSNQYIVDFSDGKSEIVTPPFLLNGWTVSPNQNLVRFIYKAIDEEGNRIKLDYAAMVVDVLEFSAVEGYFGSSPFDIPGDFIDINLFDTWISGGLEIDDPKIVLEVQNAFGFPVRSKVNKLEFHTKNGNVFPLESQYITDGINFNYSDVNNQGVLQTTYFTFDKSNSNIRQIFNDKIIRVVYDIDALPNPDFDTGVINWLNDQSFFKVNVDVRIPMLLKANKFVIGDTVDINLDGIKTVNNAVFKSVVSNNFPVDITFQGYFLNANNTIVDSLFTGSPITLASPALDSNGKTIDKTTATNFKKLSEENINSIMAYKKMVIAAGFDNPKDQTLRWIYDNYGIDLKIGAIVNLK